jgi:hypothetical protein
MGNDGFVAANAVKTVPILLVKAIWQHHSGPLADDGPGFGMKNIEIEADAAAGQIRRPCPCRVIMWRKQKIVSHAKLGRAVQAMQHRQRAFAQGAVGIHRTRSRPPVLNERCPQGGEIGQILDARTKVSIATEVIRTAPGVDGPIFQLHRSKFWRRPIEHGRVSLR